MTDTVKITMSDGTTREVHPDTIVRSLNGLIFRASVTANDGYKVTTVLEPTREHWTPYEPWMRDVLADDARVSWGATGTECRETWKECRDMSDAWQARYDTAIHPDDVPEKPTEDDPDEAVARVAYMASRGFSADTEFGVWPTKPIHEEWLAGTRAAREHIAQEADRADFNAAVDYHARAVKAEAERDEWKARHAALRADVERTRGINAGAELTFADEVIRGILDRDDERGESPGNSIERGIGEDFRRRFVDPDPDTERGRA